MKDEESLHLISKNYQSFESDLKHQKYSVPFWLNYCDTVLQKAREGRENNTSAYQLRTFIGKRAISCLPRSYKLWKAQWEHESQHGTETLDVLRCFQYGSTLMSKYPRFWMDFFVWLNSHPGCCSVTQVRRTVNASLQALALPQHEKVWPTILTLVQNPKWNLPVESQQSILQRYSIYDPTYRFQYAEFLEQHPKYYGLAATVYLDLIQTSTGAPDDANQLYWTRLSELCTQHSQSVEDYVDWQRVLKSAAQLQGVIWAQLSDAWIRRGSFHVARSVLEEGLQKVSTVRDFTIVFDAYLQLEEGLLEAAVAAEENGQIQDTEPDDWDILLDPKASSTPSIADLELAMARAEHLTSRRPILLNAVLLRQNPHNVAEWVKRGELFREQPRKAAEVLETALKTVDAKHAVNGSPSSLVTNLLEIYEKMDLEKARKLMVRVCRQHEYEFLKPDCLGVCWSAWVEFELRQEKWDDALSLAREAVAPRKTAKKANLTKSLRLWDLLLDLEESLGTFQSTKDAYERAIDIGAATVQHILNYSSFLKDQKFFEESFTAFEKGVSMFAFPHPGGKLLWKEYLTSFLERYNGTKVERTRDLFERCLEKCPPEECGEFYIMNAKFEEEFGLSKRALSVYQSMCKRVPEEERLTAYRLFIAKTKKFHGVTAARDVYQSAVSELKEEDSANLCLDFAKVETSLHEFDRARAIYVYGAQMADPRRLPEFWKQWNDFEVENGSEDTFREMLRVKRSVETAFSTVVYSGIDSTESKALSNEEAMSKFAGPDGLEKDPQRQSVVSNFVPSTKRESDTNLEEVEARVAKLRKATTNALEEVGEEDQDEIDIDDIDAEIEAAVAEAKDNTQEISTKAVPEAVFGGLVRERT